MLNCRQIKIYVEQMNGECHSSSTIKLKSLDCTGYGGYYPELPSVGLLLVSG